MRKFRKVIKWVGLSILTGVILLAIIYHELVGYGIRQGLGQLRIVREARPVEEFLADPTFPDSLKAKLRLIAEVRRFAIDSLGLKDTENYKTLYDQKGQELMWVVMAAEPFKLQAVEWSFPLIGKVHYKGFFSKERALALRAELEENGKDVIVRNPGGWSTLGWFTDPILSKMLDRSEGDLANLIIHEMSHATIFVKDQVDFNENLATFIGDRGAEQFLASRYGKDSKECKIYLGEDADYLKFSDHMLRGARKLDTLYKSFPDEMPVMEKKRLKEGTIRLIVANLDTLSLEVSPNPSGRFTQRLPNNAYFMNFRQYQDKQIGFRAEFQNTYKGNLKAYIADLSKKYPFL